MVGVPEWIDEPEHRETGSPGIAPGFFFAFVPGLRVVGDCGRVSRLNRSTILPDSRKRLRKALRHQSMNETLRATVIVELASYAERVHSKNHLSR